MNILNLYAGIGGNRKLWGDEHQVTAVEINEELCEAYKKLYPGDTVICGDAHKYLLNNFKLYDGCWSSPVCKTHSRFIRSGTNRKPRYVDMALYQEILLLKHDFKGWWVVENVIPFYEPLIKPSFQIDRHYYWSNFEVPAFAEPAKPANFIKDDSPAGLQRLKDWLGIDVGKNIYLNTHSPAEIYRNAVHPLTGKHIFDHARLENTIPKGSRS